MTVPDPETLHDLSNDDIVSTPLERPTSLLAASGIVFRGLERSESIAIREWKGKHEPQSSLAARQKS